MARYYISAAEPPSRTYMSAVTPETQRKAQLRQRDSQAFRDLVAGRGGQGDPEAMIGPGVSTGTSLMADPAVKIAAGAPVVFRHLARMASTSKTQMAKLWRLARRAKPITSVDEAKDIVRTFKTGRELYAGATKAAAAEAAAAEGAAAEGAAKAAKEVVKATDAAEASSLAAGAVGEGITAPWTVRAGKSVYNWAKGAPGRAARSLDARAKYVEAASMIAPDPKQLGRMAKMDRAIRNMGDLFFGHGPYNPARPLPFKDTIAADVATFATMGVPAAGVTAAIRSWEQVAQEKKATEVKIASPDREMIRKKYVSPIESVDEKRFRHYLVGPGGLVTKYNWANSWLNYYGGILQTGKNPKTGKDISTEERTKAQAGVNEAQTIKDVLWDALNDAATNGVNTVHAEKFMKEAANYAATKSESAQAGSFDLDRFQATAPAVKLLMYGAALDDTGYQDAARRVIEEGGY